jgi:hypothetical protein
MIVLHRARSFKIQEEIQRIKQIDPKDQTDRPRESRRSFENDRICISSHRASVASYG